MSSDFEAIQAVDWPTVTHFESPRARDVARQIGADVRPQALADALVEASVNALHAQTKHRAVAFYDEPMDDCREVEYRRACLLIGIENAELFNQLFNGRGGYRAMYRRSPDMGEAYNEMLVGRLVGAILADKMLGASSVAMAIRESRQLEASLVHPSAKVWPFFEEAFVDGVLLDLQDWREQARGNKIYCSRRPLFVVKGAFADMAGNVKVTKPDRSQRLHKHGWT
ncbi:MAG: hypothetical protein Q7T19_06240 [Caulobacter sp.]|nr:hypothetical protein [Caulobacter sp.]